MKTLHYCLSEQEHQKLKKYFTDIKYSPCGDIKYLNTLTKKAYQSLPETILDLLFRQKSSAQPSSHFVIKNLPIDTIIDNASNDAYYKNGQLSENLLCAFACLLGEPYSAYCESSELVNNLLPYKHTQHDYTGLGSQYELDLHIENAALRYLPYGQSPKGILLLGIRQQPFNAPTTYIADVNTALKCLSEKEISILKEPHYIIKTPHRWRAHIAFNQTAPIPILYGIGQSLTTNATFYADMISTTNTQAKKALNALYRALHQIKVGISIGKGDLIYIDNRIALHSRSAFTPAYDEYDRPYRWIQRIFIAADLWQTPDRTDTNRILFKETLPC